MNLCNAGRGCRFAGKNRESFVITCRSPYNRNLVMTAQTDLSVESASSRSRIWRILGAVCASLLLIPVVGIAWFLSIARSALPELDGALPVSGIAAPVSVTRDAHGIPTIESASIDDLFFAQGYITAQDRLFQMDLMRRAATGELAEAVGDIALEHDRRQ